MPSLWLNPQAWCSALTQSICSINELITESMPLCHQLPPTGKAKAQKYIWITMILLEFYLTPGSRLGHFYKSLESCLHHLLSWFYLCFHSRKMQQLSKAPGDGSPCRTEQMAPSLASTSLSGGRVAWLSGDLLSYSQSDIFQPQRVHCNFERYSL